MQCPDNRKKNAAKLSVVSNSILTLAKLIVGFMSGSVAMISEAIHSGIDLVASVIAFVSIKLASEPADEEHPYGHGKFEEIAGLAEAVLIFIAVLIILYEAFKKLFGYEGNEIQTDLAIAVMIIATIANIIVSQYLFKVAKETDSIALYADAQHLQTDVYTSVGVLISLIIVKFTGLMWIDPLTAIIVAIFISYIAYKISAQTINNLVDVSLPAEEEELIKKILCRYEAEIISVHKFKTRKSGSNRFIEFHLTVEGNLTIKEGHLLCDLIEQDLKQAIPNISVSIHMEPCTENCNTCHLYYLDPDTCRKLKGNGENKR